MKHIIDIIHQKLLKALDLFDSALMLLGSYTLGNTGDQFLVSSRKMVK